MGAALRRHVTVRPDFVRVTKPASLNTSRCFITAGNDIANGLARSLTDTLSCPSSRVSKARRVGSASAEKVRLS